MTTSKIRIYSLLHALAVVGYVVAIGYFINFISSLQTNFNGPWAIVPFLLLLTFSVAFMGVAIFGRPVYLFVSGYKKESIQFALYTIAFVFILTVLVFSAMALFRPLTSNAITSTSTSTDR